MIVDVQNCFMPSGTLPVGDADQIVPLINDIRSNFNFKLVVTSQDWHCHDHVSFASTHVGFPVFSEVNLKYTADGLLCRDPSTGTIGPHAYDCDANNVPVAHIIPQTLWPDHCVINTADAGFHADLIRERKDVLIQKGNKCGIDSYSALYDNGGFTSTELPQIIENEKITAAIVVGLATDFCVSFTAKDMQTLSGLKTFIVEDATRYISSELVDVRKQELSALGVQWIQSTDLVNLFENTRV